MNIQSALRALALVLLATTTLLPTTLTRAQPAAPRSAPAPETAPAPEAPASAPAPEVPTPAAGPRLHAAFGEGFSIESSDGQQSLRIAGLISARGTIIKDDAARTEFDAHVRLARIALMGELYGPKLTYFLNTGFAGRPRLLDAELTYAPVEQLRLRFGRMRTPASRQWIVPLSQLALPDRSVASDFFRLGRSTGMTIESYLADRRIELRAGVYAEERDRWPSAIARAAWSPLGAVPMTEHLARDPDGPTLFQIGVGASFDKRIPTVERVDPATGELVTVQLPAVDRTLGSVDLTLRAGPAELSAEAYVDRRHAEGSPGLLGAGGFAQLGVFVLPRTLELIGRFNMITPDIRGAGADGLYRYEAGLSQHFLGGALKLQVRYAYDQIIGTPVGVPFPEGHVGDAQFVLAL